MSASKHTGSLFDELKRRKVYRTTAGYGAAVFVVWQAADIAIPALGLPPSLLRFVVVAALLGFPVAIGLSWVFDLVPQDRLDGEESTPRRFPRSPIFLSAGVVTLLGAAAWMLLPRSAMALAEGDRVLVADLKNETGDSVFDGTLDEALRLSLAQSPHFNLLSAPRIRQGLAEMRRSRDATLDEPTAVELAVRLDVRGVILPSIRTIGSRYVLEMRLVDPVTERTVRSFTESAADAEGILRAVDRLARELRRGLGETLGSMARTPIQLRRATTGSLDALKAWSDGVRQGRAGHDDAAGILFQRAVELDSAFALAQASLGQWYYWNHNDAVRGDSAFDRALAHLEGVTERERLSIQGTVAQWRGNLEAAAMWFGALTALLPQDPVAWGRLGYVYLRMGRDQEAFDAYRRVTRIDSLDANAWTNLGSLHYGAGELGAAVPMYERAFRLQPDLRTNAVINEEYGYDLTLLGRIDDADSLYGLMLQRSPTSRARGLRSMALLRMYTGRYTEAVDLLRQAIVLHQAGNIAISEVRDRAFLAAALIVLERTSEALREVHAAYELGVRNHIPTILLGTVGVLGARTGRLREARELLDSATARSNGSIDDRTALEYLQGEIALADGDPARAIERLEAATALQASGPGRSVRVVSALARARLARGDREQAVTLLEEVTAATGAQTSRENQQEWILAHYRLAQLLDALGRDAGARAAYTRFLDFWGGAAPVPRQVTDARRRLAELTPG